MMKSNERVSLDAWRQIADAALDLGRVGDSRGALLMLQRGIDTARLAGEPRGETIVLNGVALLHSIRGDFWASLACSVDGFFLSQKHGDRCGMAHAMTMLAGALLLMTPIESEVGLLRSALAIAEDERDMRLQVRIHNLLGIVLGDLKRFDEAEVHLDLGLVLSECDKSGFDRWRVLANVANLHRKRAEAVSVENAQLCAEFCAGGLALIQRVVEQCREHGKVPILLDALRISAMLQALNGREDLATAQYAAAWTLAMEKKQRSVLPSLGIEIARRELESGRLNGAETTLTDALREAAQYRPSPKAAKLCELMAQLHRARDDERGEAHWMSEAARARDEFEALKREARQQLARVAQCLPTLVTR
ncbi:MAG: hypothetical protein ABI905_12385 [Betaproteobacteria bacterium]